MKFRLATNAVILCSCYKEVYQTEIFANISLLLILIYKALLEMLPCQTQIRKPKDCQVIDNNY